MTALPAGRPGPAEPRPRTVARAAAAAVLSWAAAGELPAQEPADTARADSAVVVPPSGDSTLRARLDSARRAERGRRNAAVRALRPGDRVRVRARGRALEGQFLRLAEGHLFLRRGGEDGPETPADAPGFAVQQIPVDAMQALWVRVGNAGAGALWGGILGSVGGAVGGYFINEALCRGARDCIFDSADAAVVFGLAGGLTGMGAGALIGRGFREWHRSFPGPDDAPGDRP